MANRLAQWWSDQAQHPIAEERAMTTFGGGISGMNIIDPAAIPPPGMGGHGNMAGVNVNPHTALQVDAVFTSIRIISTGIGELGNPYAYTEKFSDDNRPYKVPLANQPNLLSNTFGDGLQTIGIRQTVTSMALWGEAWWYVIERTSGYPTAVDVLNPARLELKMEKGKVVYKYNTGSNWIDLDTASIIHIPHMSLPGSTRGLSSVDFCGINMALALAAMEYGSRWYSQGASPSYILSTKNKLQQEDVDRIAEKFIIEHSGLSQSHLPLVVDNGLQVQKISSTPDEAQYLQSLALDEPILTTDGWKTMGTVETGDTVYAEDGSPTKVEDTSPVFLDSDCHELEFFDGTKVVASDDHRWHVWDNYDHQDNGGYRGRWKTITTAEVASNWKWYQDKNRYRVKCDGIVQSPETDLPIDPYLFGYWLGDGSSAASSITVGDEDLEYVKDAIAKAGCTVTSVTELNGGWGHSWRVCFGRPEGVAAALRALGVFGVGNKHIPDVYLNASPDQRMALLAGLLDSDGSVTDQRVKFSSTLPRLAVDTLTLTRSLGVRATITLPRLAQREDVKSSKQQYLVAWAATFDPFRMPRKSANVRIWQEGHRAKDVRLMSIVGVRSVESRSTRCIRVAHPSHVFLVGRTFIPTGNSLEYSRSVIASYFGVPASLLGNALQRLAPAPPHTIEEETMRLMQWCLSGYVRTIEEVLGRMLPSKGTRVSFDRTKLLQADAMSFAALIMAIKQANVLTPNEIRVRYLGEAPHPDGDVLVSPLASNTDESAQQDTPAPGVPAVPAVPAAPADPSQTPPPAK